jgi:hypothetical protein
MSSKRLSISKGHNANKTFYTYADSRRRYDAQTSRSKLVAREINPKILTIDKRKS